MTSKVVKSNTSQRRYEAFPYCFEQIVKYTICDMFRYTRSDNRTITQSALFLIRVAEWHLAGRVE